MSEYGAAINLAALIVAVLGLAYRITSGLGEITLTIERYHAENSQKIALLERDVHTIRTALSCTKLGCPLRDMTK